MHLSAWLERRGVQQGALVFLTLSSGGPRYMAELANAALAVRPLLNLCLDAACVQQCGGDGDGHSVGPYPTPASGQAEPLDAAAASAAAARREVGAQRLLCYDGYVGAQRWLHQVPRGAGPPAGRLPCRLS